MPDSISESLPFAGISDCNLIELGLAATITTGCLYTQYDWPYEDLQPFNVIKKITGNTVHLDEEKYMRVSERESTRYKFRKGDIIFKQSTSRDQLGKSILFDLDINVLHTKYLRIRANEGFDGKFLHYILNSLRYDGRLHRIATESRNISSIRIDELKKLRIPLVTFESQPS
jgi:hypothetical protein